CHGKPGSRLDWVLDDEWLRSRGLRLIAPDRPGYGLSDFRRRGRYLDWPDDVAELMDSLGIKRFAALGVSGGGPFAAACAYRLGERVTRLAIVSSVAPWLRTAGSPLNAVRFCIGFTLLHLFPWPLRRRLATITADGIRSDPASYFALQARVMKVFKMEVP